MTQIISIEKVKESLYLQCDVSNLELVAKSILGLHTFTGCDTTSPFWDKGKVKPPKIPLKSRRYNVKFANTDVSTSLRDNAFKCFSFVIFMAVKGTEPIP